MAKPQKRKQQRPSWFQKQIERDGEEFLLRKQPFEIRREAFNIVRDIVRGNVTQRDLKYLFNLTILNNVKLEIYDKYIESHIYNSSMTLAFQMPNGVQILQSNFGIDDASFQKVYNKNKDLLNAYLLTLNSLDAMIGAVQGTYASDEQRQNYYLQVYGSVQYQLSRFKFIL